MGRPKQGEAEENTGKHERFILALLAAPSVAAACRMSKVAETTGRRWLKEPHFRARLEEAKAATLSQGLARLRSAVGLAVEALESVLTNKKAEPRDRVLAAGRVLEFALKANELEDIRARIEALEAGK